MAVKITDGVTPVGVGVTNHALSTQIRDAAGNPIDIVSGSSITEGQGHLLIAGVAEGDRAQGLLVDPLGCVATSNSRVAFMEHCDGTAVNVARWTQTVSTMTITQTALGITLNAGASIATGVYAILTSRKQFGRIMNQPMHATWQARVSAPANSTVDMGFGTPTTTTLLTTNSAVWRVSGNVATPALTVNGTEIAGTGVNITSYVAANNYLYWGISIQDYTATFFITEGETGTIISQQEIEVSATLQRMFGAAGLPISCRVYTAGSAPVTAPVVVLTEMSLVALDDSAACPIEDVAAAMNLGAENHPATGLQSAQWANSAAPASATLSNTAAGYTTLGGLFQFAAVAGAATDYCLFGYQIPAPANFFCTGVDISTYNTGAAGAATPTLLLWGVMVNSTAVSLATTASRFPLGSQTLPASVAIGAMADRDVRVLFEAPKFCSAGSFLCVILRMPVGTATASQVIAGSVRVGGYFSYL